jgi:hypothetical protein
MDEQRHGLHQLLVGWMDPAQEMRDRNESLYIIMPIYSQTHHQLKVKEIEILALEDKIEGDKLR